MPDSSTALRGRATPRDERRAIESTRAPPGTAPPTTETMRRTILGFGSLLSEQSSRTTFPLLENFRLVRVAGYRRVFAHAAAIFFERGIANVDLGCRCVDDLGHA